ncbi:HNH endonuclease signature motif containing protein [Peptoclostridium acidaminophilum]|uniref:HNH endonuclease signature motif containing protein n=1 Tax=Peptoclostridium acidaminophilum TaxID=1731 RepID=UPI000570F0AD|nr:HNH endonuclease signature motif containing protein [Peptoclostridium acidaminophilum]
MAIRKKRPCKKMRCPGLAEYPNQYCEKHRALEEHDKQDRNYHYDKQVRRVKDRRFTEFYHSNEWSKARRMRLMFDAGVCQECIKHDKVTMADVVHHIVEIKDDWDKRLDMNNLVSLCHSCHNKIHG